MMVISPELASLDNEDNDELDVSCPDAELTEPFLTMIRLINAYEPLST